jgi:hypothetical protein
MGLNIKRNQKSSLDGVGVFAVVCLRFASLFGMKRETGYFEVYRFAQQATIIISSNHHDFSKNAKSNSQKVVSVAQ